MNDRLNPAAAIPTAQDGAREIQMSRNINSLNYRSGQALAALGFILEAVDEDKLVNESDFSFNGLSCLIRILSDEMFSHAEMIDGHLTALADASGFPLP